MFPAHSLNRLGRCAYVWGKGTKSMNLSFQLLRRRRRIVAFPERHHLALARIYRGLDRCSLRPCLFWQRELVARQEASALTSSHFLLKKSARLLLGRKNDFPEFLEISLFMCANNSNNEALAGRTDPIQKRGTAITAGQRKVEK